MLEEGFVRAVQKPLISNIGHEAPGGQNPPTMVAAEIKGAAIDTEIDASYAEFMKRAEGTPEYDRALESFLLLLFSECNPPVPARLRPPIVSS